MEDAEAGTLRDAVRAQALAVAEAVIDLTAPSYGPHGGHKLLEQDAGPVLLRSAASALRELQLPDPAAGRYKRLATDVQAHVGDQATAAVLLAARLVRAALDGGLPVSAALEGYGLARRQVLATLAAQARPAAAEEALAHVAPALRDAVLPILAGLPHLGSGTHIDLDRVDLRTEPRDAPEWSNGLVAAPQTMPRRRDATDAGVLVLSDAWHPKPRTAMTRGVGDPAARQGASDEEAALRKAFVDRLEALGIGLLVCAKDLDETVRDEATRHGMWVWTDAPASALRRIEDATGARGVPSPSAATGDDVGRADLEARPRRRGGLWVRGPGPAATLLLPARPGPWAGAVTDDGERLLRAAGAYLEDPRAVPGGGRWQRAAADALRRAADAAPGKAPLAVHAAAEAFSALADDLVRNHGEDPLDVPLLSDADQVLDPWPAVLLAVDAAFDTAVRILRIDARYDRRASSMAGLRGGTGPVGSPKGMPGDVPPLM